ncbi:hypothetical protein BC628DRAFT_1346352 [Trametes gibbosa]|nr:hypothetical protein BC628DRAFT_1346352 [Trametes gibbosa]
MIVQSLPKADVNPSRKPGSIPCGFYAYHKYRIFDIPSGGAQPAIEAAAPPSDPGAPAPDVPIGFYGSCMGIDFRFPSGHRFAVGMDCPNTILGGRNSTVVTTKSAKDAAELANDTHTSAQSIGVGPYKCTIRRAAALGSTNYAVCVID